ncbi:MAG: WYL domain-containing protein [Alishewanella agri]|nr:WYL domain-containing protein [Alishewanella agri]
MPAAKNHASISRQWEILMLLPRNGDGISVTDLHNKLKDNGFKTVRRTVERDLEDLCQAFPIYSNESPKGNLWRWMEDKYNKIPGVSVADAMILQLVEGTLKTILPESMLKGLSDRFELAKRKIQALDGTNSNGLLADKIAVVSPALPVIPPHTPAEFYEVIQRAMTTGKQLSAVYTAMHDRVQKEYVMNPLGLVQRGHATYLVATVGDYHDQRLFALHRFKTLDLMENTIKIPEGFSLSAYVQKGALQFGSGTTIQFVARVNAYLARILLEAPISEDMQLEPLADDWFKLTATVIDGWQLHWWILSHSLAIEVLEPTTLRHEISKRLKSAAALYVDE